MERLSYSIDTFIEVLKKSSFFSLSHKHNLVVVSLGLKALLQSSLHELMLVVGPLGT